MGKILQSFSGPSCRKQWEKPSTILVAHRVDCNGKKSSKVLVAHRVDCNWKKSSKILVAHRVESNGKKSYKILVAHRVERNAKKSSKCQSMLFVVNFHHNLLIKTHCGS